MNSINRNYFNDLSYINPLYYMIKYNRNNIITFMLCYNELGVSHYNIPQSVILKIISFLDSIFNVINLITDVILMPVPRLSISEIWTNVKQINECDVEDMMSIVGAWKYGVTYEILNRYYRYLFEYKKNKWLITFTTWELFYVDDLFNHIKYGTVPHEGYHLVES